MIGQFEGHEGAITSLVFTSDGQRLISAARVETMLLSDRDSLVVEATD